MNCYNRFGFAIALFLSIFAQTAFAASQCQYCSGSGRGECQFSTTGYHVTVSSIPKPDDGIVEWIKTDIRERFENPLFGRTWRRWSSIGFGVFVAIYILHLIVWSVLKPELKERLSDPKYIPLWFVMAIPFFAFTVPLFLEVAGFALRLVLTLVGILVKPLIG